MKIVFLILAIAALLNTCTPSRRKSLAISNQVIDYQIKNNEYAVVVVEDEEVSAAEAKGYARQRAAEITVENGARYFKIISEGQTQVVKLDRPWLDEEHQNLYQELIIEGEFGRAPSSENLYPAYRVVFEISEKKPSWRAIDACTLTECHY